jgi:hypothetical protein
MIHKLGVWKALLIKSLDYRVGISLLLVAGLIFLSRIPFLNAGYGDCPDAWRIANVARQIATTGQYSVSRFPGYPVPEYFYSLIPNQRPFAMNSVTALLSVVASTFFALSLRKLGSKDFLLGALALAFTPLVFINSTNSMDYVWALTFILGSLYFILAKHPLLAGILLGLAIGCRITSGAMLLPLVILWFHQNAGVNRRRLLTFILVSLLVGFMSFLPVILKYGLKFLTFYESNSTLLEVFYRASVSVWGILGVIALVFSVISCFLLHPGDRSIPRPADRLLVVVWWLAIILYGIAYVRLPSKAGYLLPVVPFVILLLATYLDRRIFIAFCIVLVLSPFISITHSGLVKGLIFEDHTYRNYIFSQSQNAVEIGKSLPFKSMVISGAWEPMIMTILPIDPAPNVKYVYLLTQSQLEDFFKQKYIIYYLPGVQEFNQSINGYDLQASGAKPLELGGP